MIQITNLDWKKKNITANLKVIENILRNTRSNYMLAN